MFGIVLSIMLLQSAAPPVARDDVKDALAKAEALYFEARFLDSIQILTQVSESLQGKPGRLPEKVNAKLQLALANVGLNDMDKAKNFLIQMYALDPNTVLDPQQFSPKVMTLAGDAKNEMLRIRCQAIGDDARKNLKDGNATAVRGLIGSPDSKCVDMAAISNDAADLLYKTGLEAYKRSDYSSALQNLQAALKFSPKHEFAGQYVELAQGKLQVSEERTLIQFQKNFDSKQLKDAAKDYKQLIAYNDTNFAQSIQKAEDQYRKALTELVNTWNQSCPKGDMDAMNTLRTQITELLPDPAFGEDIRAKMVVCNKPEVKTVARTEPSPAPRVESTPDIKAVVAPVKNTCLVLPAQVAMTRLKVRVDPEIPREARPYIQSSSVTVKVKIRIDEYGYVVSSETPGGNPMFNVAVKTAVDKWKFSPAMDSSGTRCVDTEIPLVIGPLTTR